MYDKPWWYRRDFDRVAIRQTAWLSECEEELEKKGRIPIQGAFGNKEGQTTRECHRWAKKDF